MGLTTNFVVLLDGSNVLTLIVAVTVQLWELFYQSANCVSSEFLVKGGNNASVPQTVITVIVRLSSFFLSIFA